MWVPNVGGVPVGFVAVRWTEEDATPVGEVELIAVAPGHQRAGIASRPFDRAVAEIAERGVRSCPRHGWLHRARVLYERHGFIALPLVSPRVPPVC